MKKVGTVAFCALTVLMCLFICIGYAAISDILSITGSVDVDPPKLPDVYIANITPLQKCGRDG